MIKPTQRQQQVRGRRAGQRAASSLRIASGALCAAAVLATPTGDALAQSALERRLASATRVECRFTALATGTWDGNTPKIDAADVDHEAAFFDIDVESGTAEAEGRFGATYIVVRHAHGYLHFMQMSDAGPLHLTTVLAQDAGDGRLKAVQTRHEYMQTVLPGFTSRPEMYVGDCEVSS